LAFSAWDVIRGDLPHDFESSGKRVNFNHKFAKKACEESEIAP